ncbi:MAG TPA: hypothetical protein VGK78_05065 [Nocardioides sp.]|uniref:hypothetical protein n=1 Tax=Nocardioides sp. TaxID=35761 RepID=UPI002F411F87
MDSDEGLFAFLDDLEQQAQALYEADRASELADRSRSEYAAVTLVSRLMASLDDDVTLDLLGVGPVSGRLRRVGPDWCLVHGAAQDWVLRLAAVKAVEGVSARSVPEVAWSPVSRLGLGSALRRLADTGVRCRLHGVDGTTRDGVLGRVGADFVEVTVAEGRVVLVARQVVAAVQSRT